MQIWWDFRDIPFNLSFCFVEWKKSSTEQKKKKKIRLPSANSKVFFIHSTVHIRLNSGCQFESLFIQCSFVFVYVKCDREEKKKKKIERIIFFRIVNDEKERKLDRESAKRESNEKKNFHFDKTNPSLWLWSI